MKITQLLINTLDCQFSTNKQPKDNIEHIKAGIEWLHRAKQNSKEGGVSEAFHMFHGWLPPYPETSGYIIETLYDFAKLTQNEQSKETAKEIGNWLISIQDQNGAFTKSDLKTPMVFDTGQIIFGLVRLYLETNDKIYLKSATEAGKWLVENQENNGEWIKFANNNISHSYYTRVAWSLIELYKVNNDSLFKTAALNNINWVLLFQNDKGWFRNAGFKSTTHKNPFTHTIAYTLRGILEIGIYLNNVKYINSVKLAVGHLIKSIKESGFIAGTLDENWQSNNKYSCLTGSAQISIVLYKLANYLNEISYSQVAARINYYLKTKQMINTKNLNIKGAIPGSYPVWGNYIHFSFPNWAVKFLVDALILEYKFNKND